MLINLILKFSEKYCSCNQALSKFHTYTIVALPNVAKYFHMQKYSLQYNWNGHAHKEYVHSFAFLKKCTFVCRFSLCSVFLTKKLGFTNYVMMWIFKSLFIIFSGQNFHNTHVYKQLDFQNVYSTDICRSNNMKP